MVDAGNWLKVCGGMTFGNSGFVAKTGKREGERGRGREMLKNLDGEILENKI